jgi:catechol 2,3-dioxygenase-like lactoylglutathione lyase family enzyme
MVSILSQYCIYVSDLEKAIEFWDDTLGIPLVSRTDLGTIKGRSRVLRG